MTPLGGYFPVVLATALVLTACTGGDESAVKVAEVEQRSVSEVVEAPGTILPRAEVALTAAAAGTVAKLAVKDGQEVRAGQVLMVIDSPEAQEQLDQARDADNQAARAGRISVPRGGGSGLADAADAAAAKAFADARKLALQLPEPKARVRALQENKRAEAAYQRASVAARTAVARFEAGLGSMAEALGSLGAAQRIQTRALLAAAQRTVDGLTVRAPLSGVVTLGSTGGGGAVPDLSGLLSQLPSGLAGQAGAMLGGAGGAPTGGGAGGGLSAAAPPLAEGVPVESGATVAQITDLSSLSLSAEVDETDILLISPGIRSEVELDAVPGARYDATVTSVAVSAQPSASGGVSYLVRLELGGGELDGAPAPRPKPGMSAVVSLKVKESAAAISVPSSAIVRDGARDTVWVVDDGELRRRVVRLGAQGDEYVQVVSGIKVGDQVVVRGADQVKEGQEAPAP